MKRFLALAAAPVLAVSIWSTAPARDEGGGNRGLHSELWGLSPEEQNDPVRFGRALVQHLGCLYCHGLGGRQGIENPNAVRKYVPAWDEAAFIERYPTPEKVRETIRKGRFPKKDPAAASNPIPMPPWGNRLSEQEMDAIIAYIWSLRQTPTESHAKGGIGAVEAAEANAPVSPLAGRVVRPAEPEGVRKPPVKPPDADNPVRLGSDLVEHLGCLYCHGLGGRQGIENPNAVRKHVPAWDSEEFIRRYPVDDGVRYVIEKGRTPAKDPEATGSPVPMPPWGNRLNKDEMDAIVAYIWSLRQTPVATHPKGGRGGD
ncbi:MAG: c-type cytochrome [Nitrospinota bacterium]